MHTPMLTSKLSLRISSEQESALDEASELTGLRTAAVVRNAIDAYTASLQASAVQEEARA
jgi:predicted DNA-binding protein